MKNPARDAPGDEADRGGFDGALDLMAVAPRRLMAPWWAHQGSNLGPAD